MADIAEQQALLTQTLMASQTLPLPKKRPCCKGRCKKEPWTDGALLTEYQKEYWEKRQPHERAQPFYPGRRAYPEGPFDGTTSYLTSYKSPENADRAMPYKPQQGEKEAQPFSPWTTYKVDYPPKEAPYARVKPVHQLQPAAGPFQDDTTNRADYRAWQQKPATPAQGRGVSVPRGLGPFEGLSSYKADYLKWPANRPPPAAPLLGQNAALPRGPFMDATTHRTSYTPKAVGPAELHRPQQETMKPEGWYDGLPNSEYRNQYIEKEGGPQARAGATTGASGTALPKGPFSGATTYGTEYRPRTAPGFVRAGKPKDEAHESGPFMGYTTYGGDFTKKDVPYARVKPVHQLQAAAGPFQDDTEHKRNFQNWGAQPPTRPVAARGTNLGTGGPFDGATTYKTDFHKMDAARRVPAGRPMSGHRGLRQPGPFDGVTTYNTDYIPKRADPSRSYRPDDCDDCDPDPDCVDY
ncbi:hypothetical protein HYH03_000686 [Edaphochlamys debaryana]|uniref:Uncharacterized protein n=1 Tax=Edaphochlamys debaryana TaxID=47281 RepID=A0A835YG55_9CHLO|nr:hypothetical protein HYH03_000686 [Edaphochlamys debaryana]|eukprot:KAG2502200.1 hypothetical protein HYH03_000686 [Edaphochlamys debaryana]